jgi:hypothetical protein
LYVAWKKLDPGQQTTHAAHVVITVPAHLVANSVQDQRALAQWFERLKALLECKTLPLLIWPKRLWDNTVGAEHDHQPLLATLLIRKSQTGQIRQKRQCRRAYPKSLQELAARGAIDGESKMVHIQAPREKLNLKSQIDSDFWMISEI